LAENKTFSLNKVVLGSSDPIDSIEAHMNTLTEYLENILATYESIENALLSSVKSKKVYEGFELATEGLRRITFEGQYKAISDLQKTIERLPESNQQVMQFNELLEKLYELLEKTMMIYSTTGAGLYDDPEDVPSAVGDPPPDRKAIEAAILGQNMNDVAKFMLSEEFQETVKNR